MSLVSGPIARYNSIGPEELEAATEAMRHPLSGFLGGERFGGIAVTELEEAWQSVFKTKHAISCNSATSGLLMACKAVGLGPGDEFITTPYTMSATTAAGVFCGATPVFVDIEPDYFCLDVAKVMEVITRKTKAIVITNLFGHPAQLKSLRYIADNRGIKLIEDSAQGILAAEGGKYAGTIGHIGAYSLNVHKHIQAGEGGVCVTNDDDLAYKMRMQRNHAELDGGPVGLNLRMTEITAAIACAQLAKVETLVASRVALANSLSSAVEGLEGLVAPVVREGCTHSYYIWALKIDGFDRDLFVKAMNYEGVPLRAGYVKPLYKLPAFAQFKKPCPVTEEVERKLACFEVCSWDPTKEQLNQIKEAFHKVWQARNGMARYAEAG